MSGRMVNLSPHQSLIRGSAEARIASRPADFASGDSANMLSTSLGPA